MSDYESRSYFKRSFAPSLGPDNRLSGQAAPFGSPTLIGSKTKGFWEQIAPTAFNKTLREGDQVLLDNHDLKRPLARVSAGTLSINPDQRGVQWSATVPDTNYAQDVVKNVRAGNYGGCSFTFSPVSESWGKNEADGLDLRTLNEVRCREISVVTFPAYQDTHVANREMVDLALERRDAWIASNGEFDVDEWYEDWRANSDASPKPYGDVKYADPKNGKCPIDTAQHVKSAWAFIHMSSHAASYPLNGVTLSSVQHNIMAAAQHFGINLQSDMAKAPVSGRSAGQWSEMLSDDEMDEMVRRMDAARVRKHERRGREMMNAGDIDIPSYTRRKMIRERMHAESPRDYREPWEGVPDLRHGRGW